MYWSVHLWYPCFKFQHSKPEAGVLLEASLCSRQHSSAFPCSCFVLEDSIWGPAHASQALHQWLQSGQTLALCKPCCMSWVIVKAALWKKQLFCKSFYWKLSYSVSFVSWFRTSHCSGSQVNWRVFFQFYHNNCKALALTTRSLNYILCSVIS